MDLIGKTIGQYQLIEVVHQGENVVYKGFQPAFNRYVAVKVLSPTRAADPVFVQQFRQDMQQLATLEHANILSIYDYGQQDGVLYMVTPFVDGGTLQERIGQYYSLQQAQQIVQPITEALGYMHRQGAVHGNLKPSNILIGAQGQPLLTDFGYTQGIDVGERENVYLSPEQSGAIDQRADVYALGVLLYEMVTGEPPPLGGVPSPRLKRPDLPADVEKVILRAMAQYPEQRFQGAGEFNYALATALAPLIAQPVSAAPAPQSPPPAVAPAPPPEAKKSRNWIFYTITGLVFLCILAAVCTGVYSYITGTDDSPIYVPIFIERPTNTPGPVEPPPTLVVTVVVPTREPIVVTSTPEPEQPEPEEPQPEQPIAPEPEQPVEPPPEEQPPAEEQPAEDGG
jgi:serine/threonine protein kinase